MKIPSSAKCVLILIFCVGVFGCTTKPHGDVLSLNSSKRLTEDQIAQMATKARLGDGQAAFKLFEHYYYVEPVQSLALKWLTQSAEVGAGVAQYCLGTIYIGGVYSDVEDLQKARFWLRKAADNGVERAEGALEELDSKSNR